MGYTTNFRGQFNLDRALTTERKEYLTKFSETRRMMRDPGKISLPDPLRLAVNLPSGDQGGYFVGAEGFAGQAHDDSIKDFNSPPKGQPGLWCQWIPTETGKAIAWNEGEKFYNYVEWLHYLITHFLAPWQHVVNGVVRWQGEEASDRGAIIVEGNQITVIVTPRTRIATGDFESLDIAVRCLEKGEKLPPAIKRTKPKTAPVPAAPSSPRYTLVAGRQIYRDGKPFIGIQRSEETSPTEVDLITRKIHALLNAAG